MIILLSCKGYIAIYVFSIQHTRSFESLFFILKVTAAVAPKSYHWFLYNSVSSMKFTTSVIKQIMFDLILYIRGISRQVGSEKNVR